MRRAFCKIFKTVAAVGLCALFLVLSIPVCACSAPQPVADASSGCHDHPAAPQKGMGGGSADGPCRMVCHAPALIGEFRLAVTGLELPVPSSESAPRLLPLVSFEIDHIPLA